MSPSRHHASGPEPGWTIEDARVDAGARFRAHAHETPHLCLMLAGALEERTRGGDTAMTVGGARFSGAARHDLDFGPQGARCLVVCPTEHDLRALPRLPDRPRFTHDPWLARLAAAAREALDAGAHERLDGLVLETLAHLARRASARAPSEPPPWLRLARELLHDDPCAVPTASALADALGVHRVHLARAFRAHFGATVGGYARRARASRALRLLRETDFPLSRVAADAGFADQSHMTRVVRALHGTTPARLRTRERAQPDPG